MEEYIYKVTCLSEPFNPKAGIVDTDWETLLEQFERPAVVSQLENVKK